MADAQKGPKKVEAPKFDPGTYSDPATSKVAHPGDNMQAGFEPLPDRCVRG